MARSLPQGESGATAIGRGGPARPQLVRAGARDAGMFLVSFTGLPLDARTGVQPIVARAARKAGVKAQPHAFRRHMATSLARNGASLPAVQSYLGPGSLEKAAGYVAVDVLELHRAVEGLETVQASHFARGRASSTSCSSLTVRSRT